MKQSGCFSSFLLGFERILKWLKIFRFLRILIKFLRFNKLIRTKLVVHKKVDQTTTNQNRFRYKKQLSESNLKDIMVKNSSPDSLNRYNSDLQLLKNLEESILEFIDIKSNYLIDCILCGKFYIVYIDLKRLQLVELCPIDQFKQTNEFDQLDKMTELDETVDKSKSTDQIKNEN